MPPAAVRAAAGDLLPAKGFPLSGKQVRLLVRGRRNGA